MKKFLLVAIAAFLTTSAFSQKTSKENVPQAVKDSFKKSFPNAQNVKWEKENHQFEAEFKIDKKEMSALFSADGKLMETEFEISVSSLPVAISNYLAKNLLGKKIKEASKITDSNGKVSYEAEVDGKDYLFDEVGNFIKSE